METRKFVNVKKLMWWAMSMDLFQLLLSSTNSLIYKHLELLSAETLHAQVILVHKHYAMKDRWRWGSASSPGKKPLVLEPIWLWL
jgi:hypothetical protein